MKLEEIKTAVLAGKTVHWANSLYEVMYSSKIDEFQVVCTDNDYTNGLTHRDGVTMNGEEEEFYIKENK